MPGGGAFYSEIIIGIAEIIKDIADILIKHSKHLKKH